MAGLIVLSSLLCAVLLAFFIANAWLIRRDMNQRFRRLQAQLERDALEVMQNMPGWTAARRGD